MYRLVAAALLAAVLPLAHASISQAGSAKQKAELDVKHSAFTEQRARIVGQLADGETYAEISPENRGKVKEALDRMDAQISSAGSVDALTAQQQAEVFNDQELVNNILTKARADSRVVCVREKTVSSRIATTQCQTIAARNRARESALNALRQVKVPTLKPR